VHSLCNKISDSGASSLSKALKVNSSLTHLDLDDNYICDYGREDIDEALEIRNKKKDCPPCQVCWGEFQNFPEKSCVIC